MSETLSPRQLRAAERMQEDEGLTGALPDEPARALLHWAQAAAIRVAASVELSDVELSERLQQIRRVARRAAEAATDLSPADIAARAAGLLAAEAPDLADEAPALAPQSPQHPLRRSTLRLRKIALLTHRVHPLDSYRTRTVKPRKGPGSSWFSILGSLFRSGPRRRDTD